MISFIDAVFPAVNADASNMSVRTHIMEGEEHIKGRYNVILYGSRYSNDVETVAILDKVGDEFTFEPYAPEYDYKVIKNVPASEALKHALSFISWHRSFRSVMRKKIIYGKGTIIGYELRPLYDPLAMGEMDVMYVDYKIKGNKVIVYIMLKESVKKILEGDGDDLMRFRD
jgi:hypothetical protein